MTGHIVWEQVERGSKMSKKSFRRTIFALCGVVLSLSISGRTLPTTAPLAPDEDEAYAHLFGDTSVPPDRPQALFWDELPEGTVDEEKETTDARTFAAAQAAKADALSSASNAMWRVQHPQAMPWTPPSTNAKVKVGAERLFEEEKYRQLIRGKRIGLITNPTGIDSRFVSTIDKFAEAPDCTLTALFAPEHGVRGAQAAGERVETTTDPITGVIVYSLHGRDAKKRPQNKPRPSMLRNVDVLVYDIQDIGNRSYTYVGTMKLCMQAAAENNKEFIVLDRPNPMGGNLVSGNVADPKFVTLVGWAPVAYLYGLTPGETAMWLNDYYKIGCKLTVVPMKGWKREMKWWDTGLPWIPTSTHMQVPEACWYIAITGMLGELLAVNVGVGYPYPFAYVGAPWMDARRLAAELNSRNLPGLYFRPAYFKPFYSVYKDKLCEGVQIHILDFDKVEPVEAGIHLIEAIQKLYPEQRILYGGAAATPARQRARVGAFNKVMGTTRVRRQLLEGKSAEEIIRDWSKEREEFRKSRERYFLYR